MLLQDPKPSEAASQADSKPLSPAELRALVCSDHVRFRGSLKKIIDLLDQEHIDNHGDAFAAARPLLTSFGEEFLAHMALEDTYLVPMLRHEVGWGEIRADEVLSHHAAQRKEFNRLLDALEDADADREVVVEGFRHFLTDFEIDMRHEEKALLKPSVLGG